MFILNVVGFDLAWFGLIYWGNSFIPIALLLLCLHFYFASNKKLSEFFLVCTVTAIGVFVDSMLQHVGVFVFPEGELIPLWLITLWFCFAATLCHSLHFLQRSKLIQWLVGACLAPVSYVVGHEMNVVSFGLSVTNTYIILSVIWGILMIVFFSLKSFYIHKEVRYA